jgi:3-oxoadipate enol-lactonase
MPTVRVNDIQMYYKVHGKGDPLVLIHGLTMDHVAWSFQVPAFSADRMVLVFDNRGVGQSDAPDPPYTTSMMAADTIGVMDAAGIGSAHVLGMSLGGMIAQKMALEFPERVKSLVLAGSSACPLKGAPRSRFVIDTLRRMARAGVDVETRTRIFMAWNFTENFFVDPVPAEMVVNLMAANHYPQSPQGLAGQAEASWSHDTRDRLGEIRVPTLVLVGDQDLLLSVDQSRELAEGIPGARLEILKGGGHSISFEHTEAFNRIVLDFLNRL